MLTDKYTEALTTEPIISGYVRPTLNQILAADQYIWTKVGERTDGACRGNPATPDYPVRKALKEVLAEGPVIHMLGLQWTGGTKATLTPKKADSDDSNEPPKKKSKAARQRAGRSARSKELQQKYDKLVKEEENRHGAWSGSGKWGSWKSDGGQWTTRENKSTDDASRKRSVKMPSGLDGGDCVPATTKGKSICFGFNLGTCKVKGNKCDKGLHICCQQKCFQGHAYCDRHQGPGVKKE